MSSHQASNRLPLALSKNEMKNQNSSVQYSSSITSTADPELRHADFYRGSSSDHLADQLLPSNIPPEQNPEPITTSSPPPNVSEFELPTGPTDWFRPLHSPNFANMSPHQATASAKSLMGAYYLTDLIKSRNNLGLYLALMAPQYLNHPPASLRPRDGQGTSAPLKNNERSHRRDDYNRRGGDDRNEFHVSAGQDSPRLSGHEDPQSSSASARDKRARAKENFPTSKDTPRQSVPPPFAYNFHVYKDNSAINLTNSGESLRISEKTQATAITPISTASTPSSESQIQIHASITQRSLLDVALSLRNYPALIILLHAHFHYHTTFSTNALYLLFNHRSTDSKVNTHQIAIQCFYIYPHLCNFVPNYPSHYPQRIISPHGDPIALPDDNSTNNSDPTAVNSTPLPSSLLASTPSSPLITNINIPSSSTTLPLESSVTPTTIIPTDPTATDSATQDTPVNNSPSTFSARSITPQEEPPKLPPVTELILTAPRSSHEVLIYEIAHDPASFRARATIREAIRTHNHLALKQVLENHVNTIGLPFHGFTTFFLSRIHFSTALPPSDGEETPPPVQNAAWVSKVAANNINYSYSVEFEHTTMFPSAFLWCFEWNNVQALEIILQAVKKTTKRFKISFFDLLTILVPYIPVRGFMHTPDYVAISKKTTPSYSLICQQPTANTSALPSNLSVHNSEGSGDPACDLPNKFQRPRDPSPNSPKLRKELKYQKIKKSQDSGGESLANLKKEFNSGDNYFVLCRFLTTYYRANTRHVDLKHQVILGNTATTCLTSFQCHIKPTLYNTPTSVMSILFALISRCFNAEHMQFHIREAVLPYEDHFIHHITHFLFEQVFFYIFNPLVFTILTPHVEHFIPPDYSARYNTVMSEPNIPPPPSDSAALQPPALSPFVKYLIRHHRYHKSPTDEFRATTIRPDYLSIKIVYSTTLYPPLIHAPLLFCIAQIDIPAPVQIFGGPSLITQLPAPYPLYYHTATPTTTTSLPLGNQRGSKHGIRSTRASRVSKTNTRIPSRSNEHKNHTVSKEHQKESVQPPSMQNTIKEEQNEAGDTPAAAEEAPAIPAVQLIPQGPPRQAYFDPILDDYKHFLLHTSPSLYSVVASYLHIFSMYEENEKQGKYIRVVRKKARIIKSTSSKSIQSNRSTGSTISPLSPKISVDSSSEITTLEIPSLTQITSPSNQILTDTTDKLSPTDSRPLSARTLDHTRFVLLMSLPQAHWAMLSLLFAFLDYTQFLPAPPANTSGSLSGGSISSKGHPESHLETSYYYHDPALNNQSVIALHTPHQALTFEKLSGVYTRVLHAEMTSVERNCSDSCSTGGTISSTAFSNHIPFALAPTNDPWVINPKDNTFRLLASQFDVILPPNPDLTRVKPSNRRINVIPSQQQHLCAHLIQNVLHHSPHWFQYLHIHTAPYLRKQIMYFLLGSATELTASHTLRLIYLILHTSVMDNKVAPIPTTDMALQLQIISTMAKNTGTFYGATPPTQTPSTHTLHICPQPSRIIDSNSSPVLVNNESNGTHDDSDRNNRLLLPSPLLHLRPSIYIPQSQQSSHNLDLTQLCYNLPLLNSIIHYFFLEYVMIFNSLGPEISTCRANHLLPTHPHVRHYNVQLMTAIPKVEHATNMSAKELRTIAENERRALNKIRHNTGVSNHNTLDNDHNQLLKVSSILCVLYWLHTALTHHFYNNFVDKNHTVSNIQSSNRKLASVESFFTIIPHTAHPFITATLPMEFESDCKVPPQSVLNQFMGTIYQHLNIPSILSSTSTFNNYYHINRKMYIILNLIHIIARTNDTSKRNALYSIQTMSYIGSQRELITLLDELYVFVMPRVFDINPV